MEATCYMSVDFQRTTMSYEYIPEDLYFNYNFLNTDILITEHSLKYCMSVLPELLTCHD
jgi:hypothetical protein